MPLNACVAVPLPLPGQGDQPTPVAWHALAVPTKAGPCASMAFGMQEASLVRVVNTGRVIPPDQADRLFLPFTRPHEHAGSDNP